MMYDFHYLSMVTGAEQVEMVEQLVKVVDGQPIRPADIKSSRFHIGIVERSWKATEERCHAQFGFSPTIMCRRIDEGGLPALITDGVAAPQIAMDQ